MFGGTKVSGILKIYKPARRFFGVCSGLCSREPTSALADTDGRIRRLARTNRRNRGRMASENRVSKVIYSYFVLKNAGLLAG